MKKGVLFIVFIVLASFDIFALDIDCWSEIGDTCSVGTKVLGLGDDYINSSGTDFGTHAYLPDSTDGTRSICCYDVDMDCTVLVDYSTDGLSCDGTEFVALNTSSALGSHGANASLIQRDDYPDRICADIVCPGFVNSSMTVIYHEPANVTAEDACVFTYESANVNPDDDENWHFQNCSSFDAGSVNFKPESGVYTGGGNVPEFSAYGLIFALLTISIGYVLIMSKKNKYLNPKRKSKKRGKRK